MRTTFAEKCSTYLNIVSMREMILNSFIMSSQNVDDAQMKLNNNMPGMTQAMVDDLKEQRSMYQTDLNIIMRMYGMAAKEVVVELDLKLNQETEDEGTDNQGEPDSAGDSGS